MSKMLSFRFSETYRIFVYEYLYKFNKYCLNPNLWLNVMLKDGQTKLQNHTKLWAHSLVSFLSFVWPSFNSNMTFNSYQISIVLLVLLLEILY